LTKKEELLMAKLPRATRRTLIRILALTSVVALVVTLGFTVGKMALPLAAQSPSLPTNGLVTTEGDRLNLRAAPTSSADIIGKIEPQSTIQVLAVSDDGAWYQISASGVGTGWVSSEWVGLGSSSGTSTEGIGIILMPTPTPGAVSATLPRLGIAVLMVQSTTGSATQSVTEPTTTSQATTALVVTESPAAVAPTTLPTSLPTPLPPPVVEATVPTAIIQPAQMNVRSGPGTGFSVVAGVTGGTALEISGAVPTGDWYRVVLASGEIGWVFASLVQVVGPSDTIVTLTQEELPTLPTPDAASAAPAAVAPPVVIAPPPAGGGSFGYGVQAHMLGGEAGGAVNAVSDMGFNWIKQQVEWRLFQPDPGAMGFADLSVIVNEANARGINVLFSVVNAPGWAREPGFDGGVGGPPADPATYAAFVGGMARQFCGTALKAIEVWNEQNLHYEWGNKPLDPAEYMRLLSAAYASIKSECPSMMVISGALTPAGSNPPFAIDDFAYLEGMYQNGLAQYADGIGAHPSGYNVPASVRFEEACAAIQQNGNSFNGACDTPHHSWSFRSTMEGYRNIMNVYGDSNKRVWPTEFGWAAGGAFDPRYAYANDNSFDEQAAWTVEAYTMMRDWGWVGPAFLWNLNFRVVADGTEKAQWGIVGNDWTPLPVYLSLKSMGK
jgi:uncharacterized protein YgiM (DUF1202 family)